MQMSHIGLQLCHQRHQVRPSLLPFYKKGLSTLASSGPYGPLLARSGYPGQDASFYNNPMVMICVTVNALTLLQTILYEVGRICATRNAFKRLEMILHEF